MSCANQVQNPDIRLGSTIVIATISAVKSSIVEKRCGDEIVVDASEVETIDLAGLQLIAAIGVNAPGNPRRRIGARSQQLDAAMSRAGFPASMTH
jgi:hypothetical protein